jgi:hypothetical protein
MKTAHIVTASALVFGLGVMLFLAGACSTVKRVPPGHSVAFSMAPKPEVVSTPAPETPEVAVTSEEEEYYVGPAVEPELPTADFSLPEELAAVDTANSFATQGSNYLAAGKNGEAIDALKQAVKLEPNLSTAWRDLAIAYENVNEPEKAKEARENYKHYGGL